MQEISIEELTKGKKASSLLSKMYPVLTTTLGYSQEATALHTLHLRF